MCNCAIIVQLCNNSAHLIVQLCNCVLNVQLCNKCYLMLGEGVYVSYERGQGELDTDYSS